jgi:hypothetical protein
LKLQADKNWRFCTFENVKCAKIKEKGPAVVFVAAGPNMFF